MPGWEKSDLTKVPALPLPGSEVECLTGVCYPKTLEVPTISQDMSSSPASSHIHMVAGRHNFTTGLVAALLPVAVAGKAYKAPVPTPGSLFGWWCVVLPSSREAGQ